MCVCTSWTPLRKAFAQHVGCCLCCSWVGWGLVCCPAVFVMHRASTWLSASWQCFPGRLPTELGSCAGDSPSTPQMHSRWSARAAPAHTHTHTRHNREDVIIYAMSAPSASLVCVIRALPVGHERLLGLWEHPAAFLRCPAPRSLTQKITRTVLGRPLLLGSYGFHLRKHHAWAHFTHGKANPSSVISLRLSFNG